jgi:hypothetical protein
MGDFLVAIGLVFAIEGILFAAFPAIAKRLWACFWSGWFAGETKVLRVFPPPTDI